MKSTYRMRRGESAGSRAAISRKRAAALVMSVARQADGGQPEEGGGARAQFEGRLILRFGAGPIPGLAGQGAEGRVKRGAVLGAAAEFFQAASGLGQVVGGG